MDSFYGGRPGASFIIVKTFEGHDDNGTHVSGYDEMIENFSLGNGYNEVYFDEYVTIYDIVSTAHNGEIYRRGYNLNNGLGGAEPVGKITGPAGYNTIIDLLPYENINSTTAAGQPIYSNIQSEATSAEYWSGTENTIELIPGAVKNQNGQYDTFNNNIVYKYYNVIDQNSEVNKMKIGFQIPYPVFNFRVEEVNADQTISIQKNESSIENRPFYQDWTIFIPRSYKGNSITKLTLLRMDGISGINVNYDFYNQETTFEGYDPSLTPQENKKNYDIQHNTVIIACEITSYNVNGTPNPQLYYVADYEFISNIDINEQGYLTFWLPDGTEINSSVSILPTIESMNMNDYGEISIQWKNTNNTEGISTFENQVKWIKDIEYDTKGLKITWNTKATDDNNEIIYEIDGVTPSRETSIIKLNGLETIINNLIDEKLKTLNIVIPQEEEDMTITPKDFIIKSQLIISFAKNRTSLELHIPLTKKLINLLPQKNLLQQESQMKQYIISEKKYDKSIFNRIYLTEIDESQLNQIYTNNEEDYNTKLNKWQNIARFDKYTNFFSTEKIGEDYIINKDYAFIRGFGGYIGTDGEPATINSNNNAGFMLDRGTYNGIDASSDIASRCAHQILTNNYGPYFKRDVNNLSPSTTLAGSSGTIIEEVLSGNKFLDGKNIIIDTLLCGLTGIDFISTDPNHNGIENNSTLDSSSETYKLISAASYWDIINYGDNKLTCTSKTLGGLTGTNWEKLRDKTFLINVTVELNSENLLGA